MDHHMHPENAVQTKTEEEYRAYRERLEGQLHTNNLPPTLALLFLCCALAVELLVFGGPHGAAVPVIIILLCPLGLWYLQKRKALFSRKALLWLVPLGLLCAGYLFNTSVLTNWITLPVVIVLFGTLLVTASGASGYACREAGFAAAAAELLVPRTLCALPMPLRLPQMRASRSEFRKSQVRWAVLGLVCALPFFILLAVLFSLADTVFRQGVTSVLEKFNPAFAGHVAADLLLGLPLFLYLGSALMVLRSAVRLRPPVGRAEGRLQPAAVASFLSVLILLELTFGAIQFRYLFCGGMRLPDGTSFAEYARSGFFQIAAASILTVGIIVGVTLLTKKKDGALPLTIKSMLSLFSCCVGVLYASAFYRMGLYIGEYGLSVKRLMVCWLMALLGILLGGVLYRVWKPDANLAVFLLFTVLFMTLFLGVLRVDALTAQVNVERYLRNPQTSVDVNYLESLSTDALPALQKLMGTPLEERARDAMAEIQYRGSRGGWRTWSVSRQRGEKLLKDNSISYDRYAKQTRAQWPDARVAERFGSEGRAAILQREDGTYLLVDREQEYCIAQGVVRWMEKDNSLLALVEQEELDERYYLALNLSDYSHTRIQENVQVLTEYETWALQQIQEAGM